MKRFPFFLLLLFDHRIRTRIRQDWNWKYVICRVPTFFDKISSNSSTHNPHKSKQTNPDLVRLAPQDRGLGRIALENYSNFRVILYWKRKKKKKGKQKNRIYEERDGRGGRATRVGKTHVTSRPSRWGAAVRRRFHGEHRGEPRRANRASQPETANNRDIACLVARRALDPS